MKLAIEVGWCLGILSCTDGRQLEWCYRCPISPTLQWVRKRYPMHLRYYCIHVIGGTLSVVQIGSTSSSFLDDLKVSMLSVADLLTFVNSALTAVLKLLNSSQHAKS
jgi:hypothetical protein